MKHFERTFVVIGMFIAEFLTSSLGMGGVPVDTSRASAYAMVQAVSKRQIRGFATLAFTLPEKVDTDEIDVKVTGKLGDFSEDADGRFRVNHFSNVSLSTDKPIYQPGQTLHKLDGVWG